jgi:dTDP-4-amino-4,6-dideoxygalactose transaminase
MLLYAGYGEHRDRKYDRGAVGQPQHYVAEGLNERLDELQAAILRAKLPHLADQIEARRENALSYNEALEETGIRLPIERPGYRHTYRNYVIRVSQQEHVQRALAEAGIANALLYVPPLHLQSVYKDLGYQRGDFPVTEAICDSLISIPVGPHLTADRRSLVIQTLKEAEV